jgi:hypothetical protein
MTALAHPPHPVTRVVLGVREQLTCLTTTPVWSMTPGETTATIADLGALAAQVAELKARLLSHATRIDLPGATAASCTANWHAHTTKTTRPTARRAMRLATGLETHEPTRQALSQGTVHLEQAEVILRALAELPDDLDPPVLAKAEAYLLGQAAHHDAQTLRIMGRHLLEVIDPDAADAHEAKLLEREERDAQAATRLTMWENDGKVHGRFTLDILTGAILKKAVLAFASRRHRASTGPLDPELRPTPERLGRAFTELIQHYPAKQLPHTGGLNATVVVTMTLQTLEGRCKAASLDTGQRLSPGAARRLACEARIIPAVLGGRSQVLDLGRSARFATEPQRIAKMLQTGGCEIDSCDQPPGRTHAHHKKRWVDGGTTNLDDLVSLCPWHHHRAHDQRYELTRLPTGIYTFHRRT